MTTDPSAWFLAGQALDHHGTVDVLRRAVEGQLGEALAEDLAADLAAKGYALVPLNAGAELAHDLTGQVDAALQERAATSWFDRKED